MRSGLIAKDIHRSVLPETFRVFGRDVGVECSFEVMNVSEPRFVQTVEHARVALDGFVVTMPYKRRILELVDEISDSAAQCGSCNIVKVVDGRLVAHNTDGWGFVKAMALKGISVKGMHVVMVGAGGVAMSLAYHLREAGVARVDVLNAFPEETERLCQRFGDVFAPHSLDAGALKACSAGADLFLNASILGQVGYPDFEDLSFLDGLPGGAVVFDVNYSNPDARLPAAATARGLASYTGRCMSICQGILAMEIWTGRAPSDQCAKSLVETMEGE